MVRNERYRKNAISVRERHNERKNEVYSNPDVLLAYSHNNVTFKACEAATYAQQFDRMVEEGVVSTRGLKPDAYVFDELVFDVNTDYFETHGGYEYAKQFYAEVYELAKEIAGGEQYIISAVMHADERNREASDRLGRDVFHYHLHVVSNGTASASVTVIVNRNASSSGNGGDSTDSSNGEVITDPVVEAIEADGTDEVTFAQREVPTITGEMLNALRLNGKTLVVEADNYTIRIAGRDVKSTSAQVSTALSFAPSEYGVTFTLNGGEALPGVVQVEMTGDNAAYTRVYLHNAVKGKWQFLNSYKDNVLEADTAGEYLLTTQNLRFAHVDMTFFIAGLVVIVGIIIAYIVIKKRYWFW